MGRLRRLKIKDELRYRKAGARKSRCCAMCAYFVPDFTVRSCGTDNEPIRKEGRCRIIGLEHGSRYRIRPDYTCDRHTTCEQYEEFKVRAKQIFEF